MKKKPSQVDLAKLFNSVTTTLKENQESLNAADELNHNHGDNMVKNFQVITKAIRAKKGCQPAEQLAFASEKLDQQSKSGSARLYSQGLAQAAGRLKGKPAVNQEDAMLLIQALMGSPGAPQSSQAGAGSGTNFLDTLMVGQSLAPQQQQQSAPGDGDLLGGLFGALMGGETAAQPAAASQHQGDAGIDLNTLLTAGMTFLQAREQGAAPLEAVVQAVLAGSNMQDSTHHSQSGQLVVQTLLNTLGKMMAGKK